MNPTVLVTGATGKTGRRLLPALLERGATVRAASRRPAAGTTGAQPVRFDWHDSGTYGDAVAGADGLYLVPPSYVLDPGKEVESLLSRAVDAGVGRVVLLSALGVDQADDTLPMRRVELVVESSGVPWTILRPAAFMENFSEEHWSRSAETIRERGELVMAGGAVRAGFVSARDIAEVAAVTLTTAGHEGRGYTLTGPQALTPVEVAGLVAEALGRPVRHVEAGLETVHDALVADGAPEDYASFLTGMYRMTLLSGAMGPVTEDVALVTGRPPTTFAEYARNATAVWGA